MFIHDLKKNVGPIKYKNINKKIVKKGKKSKKKEKNKNSAIKKIEPGNPKNIKQFRRLIKNSFGHIKFIPPISVISLVLNRLFMASTSKNEFDDKRA